MSTLQIPPGQTYPPTNGRLAERQYHERGPYLYRHPGENGVTELRIPSPYFSEEANAAWKKNGLRCKQRDDGRYEWRRPTGKPLLSLAAAASLYEKFYPEFAESRPIETPTATIGRADFIVGNPDKVIVCEWQRGWSPRDPMDAYAEHDAAEFDLEWALDWCRRAGAELVESADGDYIRAFFDGLRSIRTRGQIKRKRRMNPIAQAEFAHQ